MADKKLFLLDGHALVYRAHYSFITRPLINSKGWNTSAISGFVRTLLDLMSNQKPSHNQVVDCSWSIFKQEKAAQNDSCAAFSFSQTEAMFTWRPQFF